MLKEGEGEASVIRELDKKISKKEVKRSIKLLKGGKALADDVILMAKDEVEMQKMLRVVEGFAKKWRFRLSVAKSIVVRWERYVSCTVSR